MTDETLSLFFQFFGYIMDKINERKPITDQDKERSEEIMMILKAKGFTFSNEEVKKREFERS